MVIELTPRIVVFGVGGAGGNAVDNMIAANLQGVEFVVANTDSQALARSKAPTKIQLGPETTQGLGAGAKPAVGAAAAEESMSEVDAILDGAHMVFVAAGMGGGTGTGAAPIIARMARERGVLTVGVVTKPFGFEGARRMVLAEQGLAEIKKQVDTMIIVPNQNLFRVANERTTFADAFRMADDVLYAGVRGITDLMVMPGLINLDFADVRTVMAGMGPAMMGMGEAEGETRARDAAKSAIENPLLDDVNMAGAKGVLINITGGYDMTLFEVDEAANEVRREVDPNAEIILGSTFDPDLEGKLRVSVVAVGLDGRVAPVAPPVQVTAEESPVVVRREGAPAETVFEEEDERPDFAGRPLPQSHVPGQTGDEQVSADAVFGQAKAELESGGGFSNLFGWRREGEAGDPSEAPAATPAVSSPDDRAQAAPFDDEDLEIPAFLRRSANH
ncbi:MAG: cell division protein FtsZ [Pseudomonadota bacterium]